MIAGVSGEPLTIISPGVADLLNRHTGKPPGCKPQEGDNSK
jgi:hypothetical protein